MCKNLFVAGVKKENTDKLWKFLIQATPFMTVNDRDGVGYAAVDAKGSLFGERWLRPEDAWILRNSLTERDKEMQEAFGGALIGAEEYNEFGEGDVGSTTSVILHARMATCGKSMENTHPFVRGNTALIHNGVIRNADKLTNITSTCDSETILNEYVESDVSNKPDAIKDVTDKLVGYYACGVLTEDKDGKRYLDIFRGNGAQLYAAYVEELDAVVFATNEAIIKGAAKECKFTLGFMFKVADEMMIRLDAVTGELISIHKFKAGDSWSNGGGTTSGYGGGYSGGRGYGGYGSAESHALMKGSLADYDAMDPYDYVGDGYRRK